MESDTRVGRSRALKILVGEDESPRSNPQSFHKHFRCKMDPEMKRKFNSCSTEKRFAQENRSKPATKRSNNEFEFVNEISNEK